MKRLNDPRELREMRAAPNERALGKVMGHLDRYCARFIELSPFCILGSTDPKGRPDLSPRGGPPGFVRVLGPQTLFLEDRPGNNRLDSLSNLITNSSVALLFMVPGIDETLRVYGAAQVLSGSDKPGEMLENDRRPGPAIEVAVMRAYFQCAKSLMRARLWAPDARIDRSSFPPLGEILKEQLRSESPAESQEEMVQRYLKQL